MARVRVPEPDESMRAYYAARLRERIEGIGADGVYTAFGYYRAFEYLVVAR